jgi:hypothetical protein
MGRNFIKTSDSTTIEHLRNMGLKEIRNDSRSGIVTFLNDTTKPVAFAGAKLVYTDKIEV